MSFETFQPDACVEVEERGPSSGYDFSEKAEYRNRVWGSFRKLVGDSLVPNAVGLLFPGKSGEEIRAAIRHGFREKNLIAVDENPAILATAKWRQEYPRVRCYGSEVGRALERIISDGIKVDVANLDYCSNFTGPLIESLKRVGEMRGAFSLTAAISVTTLRGREDTATVVALEMLKESEGWSDFDCEKRVGAALNIAGFGDYVADHGKYTSGKQGMAWAIGTRHDIHAEVDARLEASRDVFDWHGLRRMATCREDLFSALHHNGNPLNRYPRRFGGKNRQLHGSVRDRAREYCKRKREKIDRRLEAISKRMDESEILEFPAPQSVAPRVRVGRYLPLCDRASFLLASRYGEWLPFDKWFVNRRRLVNSRPRDESNHHRSYETERHRVAGVFHGECVA